MLCTYKYDDLQITTVKVLQKLTLGFMHFPSFFHCFLQNNRISAITDQTFCKGNTSYYVRTKMDEVRLDGNPVVLANYPYSFICLKTLPLGWYN